MWALRRTGVTTNASVLDVVQTTKLGIDTSNELCNLFEEGGVDRCSANNTVVNRKFPTQHDGGEGCDEDCEGEEHQLGRREKVLSRGGREFLSLYKTGIRQGFLVREMTSERDTWKGPQKGAGVCGVQPNPSVLLLEADDTGPQKQR